MEKTKMRKQTSNSERLEENVSDSFFYDSVRKLISRDSSKLAGNNYIPGCMMESGQIINLPIKINPCTPLQAYLLEFNFGYQRVR